MSNQENSRGSLGTSRLLIIGLGSVVIVLTIGLLTFNNGQNTSEQVIQDIQIIVSGNFSPDHLGPDEYQKTIERVLERPGTYLDEFTRMYFGMNYRLIDHLDLNIPQLLIIANKSESDQIKKRVRYLAELLISHYSNILKIYEDGPDRSSLSPELSEETDRELDRLRERRTDLQLLLEQEQKASADSTD